VFRLVALDNLGKPEHFDNIDKVLDDRIGELGVRLTDDIDNLAPIGQDVNYNYLEDRVSLARAAPALVNNVIVFVLDLTRLGVNARRLESLLIDDKDGGDWEIYLSNPPYIDAVGLFNHLAISNILAREQKTGGPSKEAPVLRHKKPTKD
jgi:hypothetical protein